MSYLRKHTLQDQIYGPLEIPQYCWPIIDSEEFQRLRNITQLGPVSFVYPGANHTRFEHSLGCCHLAMSFLRHLQIQQPEIAIEDSHRQAVAIAALCHDLGHGPFSHCFDPVARSLDPEWCVEQMSTNLLKYIVNKHKLDFSSEVIEAACSFIFGQSYDKYPFWLSQIVSNQETDIDIDKFDYLARDMNRTINISRFEYDRLIINCRVTEGRLSWKLSEIPTIERLFYNRNDMHMRVYKHRVVQSIGLMLTDIFEEVSEHFRLDEAISDPECFYPLDERILYRVETGEYGQKAQELALRIKCRKLYKCIGEVRVRPNNAQGEEYSQRNPFDIAQDICDAGDNELDPNMIRVGPLHFRYGLRADKHPLLTVPFWKPGEDKICHLQKADFSCIVPQHFTETSMRIFIVNSNFYEKGKTAFQKWHSTNGII